MVNVEGGVGALPANYSAFARAMYSPGLNVSDLNGRSTSLLVSSGFVSLSVTAPSKIFDQFLETGTLDWKDLFYEAGLNYPPSFDATLTEGVSGGEMQCR